MFNNFKSTKRTLSSPIRIVLLHQPCAAMKGMRLLNGTDDCYMEGQLKTLTILLRIFARTPTELS